MQSRSKRTYASSRPAYTKTEGSKSTWTPPGACTLSDLQRQLVNIESRFNLIDSKLCTIQEIVEDLCVESEDPDLDDEDPDEIVA